MAKTIDAPAAAEDVVRPDQSSERVAAKERRRVALKRWGWRFAGYAFFLGIWDIASGTVMSERLLVPPIAILQEIREIFNSGELWFHLSSTLTKIAIGFALAFVLGAIIGLLTQSRWWEAFFKDWVTATMTTPGLVYALVSGIIFGFSPAGPIFAIVLASFSYVTVNVAEGIRALPKDLIDMGTAFRVGGLSRLRNVVIPHLAPYLFTGIRYGFSIAWKVTVLTEVFASNVGIGFTMRVQYQLFSMSGLLAWIAIFFILMLILEKVVLQLIEQRFFRWREEVSLA
jgi:NitT/TauT family transport system permease protein